MAIMAIGLLHGLDPSHGWPVALLYAVKHANPLKHGFLASAILSLFHLISSFTVVIAYLLLSTVILFASPWMNYIAAGLLFLLAVKIWFAGNEAHPSTDRSRLSLYSLRGITVLAFTLGFAHEEEFALLALAMGGIDPYTLMMAYALAVAVGLVGITLLGVKVFDRLEERLKKHHHLLPRISALLLVALGLSFITGLR
jgi:ABC-type nickel/cobalt efflux system permease component RcnA